MMFRLLIHKNVIKFLQTRPNNEKLLINKKLELLTANPYNHPELDIKKLIGNDIFYRLRVGRYRFIYTIDHDKLVILLMIASTRGDVYKKK